MTTLREAAQQALEALEYGHFAVADQAPHAGVMAYLEATDKLRKALAEPERKPLTDKDLEPLRIRLMSAAYDAADDDQSETYNDIKVLCGVLLDLVKRAVTALDNANLKEDQFDYIAQQIKSVAGGVSVCKPLTLEIHQPNEAGSTLVTARWFVDTPHGWIGAWDREAIEYVVGDKE